MNILKRPKIYLTLILFCLFSKLTLGQTCLSGAACYIDDETGETVLVLIYPSSMNELPEEVTINFNSIDYILTPDYSNSPTQRYNDVPFNCGENSSGWDFTISYTVNGQDFLCEVVDGNNITITPPPPFECATEVVCHNGYLGLLSPNGSSPAGGTFYFPNNPELDGKYGVNFNLLNIPPNTTVFEDLLCSNNTFTIVYEDLNEVCVYVDGLLCEGCDPYYGPDCQAVIDECGSSIVQYVESTFGTGCKVWEGDCNTDGDIFRTGSVAINTATIPNGFNLAVRNGILTEQFKVCNTDTDWCDYVFEKDYELLTLKEVDAFIKKNGHLHKTPSAKEIEAQKGFDVLDVTINQQEKIEEIFLHLIELDKQISSLEEDIQ